MYSQLLAYFQAKYKLIGYLVTIVGGYLVIATGTAQAKTGSIDPDSDLFDLDNISPSQLFGKSTIDPDADRFDFDSDSISSSQLFSKASIEPNTDRFDFDSDNISSIQLFSKATTKRIAKPAAIVKFPVVPQIAQIIDPAAIEISLPIQISLPQSEALPPQSTTRPLNSILTPELIQAPNNTSAVPATNAPTPPRSNSTTQDPRFILPPQVLDPNQVDPFSTQFVLNGDRISHLTSTVAKSGFESGNFRTSDLNFNIYQLIRADSIQSVTRDIVVRVNSKLESVGVRSVAQQQDIAVSVSKPQTLLGVREQVSLDADCLDGSGRTCTYLPGLKIDESTLNRQLQPTGAKITSQFGDVISPASVTAIRQPDFQSGANGQDFGIDLTIPAIGLVTTPWSANPILTGNRREDLNSTVAVNYTRMNQDFATNGVESTLGRTTRSINYIHHDRNQLLNLAVLALGQVLPEFQPSIASGKPGTRIVVNPNLYRAANAVRIPENSQTVYQTGMGYAVSRGQDPKIPPAASHQAIWVGLSPVVDRELVRDYYYATRRAPQIVSQGGGEGGGLPVAVNLNDFGFNSSGLQNAYGQGYVTVYNRDVDRVDVETIRQRTDYYPHISFSGTSLTENTLWRYYTGAIVNLNLGSPAKSDQNIKAYVGTDYSVVNPQGLSFSVGGVGYLNPDPEYSTQLFANATHSIGLGSNPRHHLVVGFNANYILDGATTIQSLPIRSAQSFVNTGLTVNLGDISFGGTQLIGNILPESTSSKTIFNVGWKITNRLNLGAFYTAADQNISTNPYGASLSLALDPSSNSSLYLGWNAAEIDFRRTLGATSNIYRDNTFSLSVRHEF
jgi:hypothetical protein